MVVNTLYLRVICYNPFSESLQWLRLWNAWDGLGGNARSAGVYKSRSEWQCYAAVFSFWWGHAFHALCTHCVNLLGQRHRLLYRYGPSSTR